MEDSATLLQVNGVIATVTFKAEDSGFAILRMKVDKSLWTSLPVNSKGQITIVGTCGTLDVGDEVEISGHMITHKEYGQQISVQSYDLKKPTQSAAIIRYLQNRIHHLGPVLARRIVEHFGPETLQILDADPQALREVTAIGPKRVGYVIEQWELTRALRELEFFLTKVKIGNRFSDALLERYGTDVVKIIQYDPFILARDIKGIGFLTANEVANQLGIAELSPVRIRGAIEHTLRDKMETIGDCFQYQPELIQATQDLLNNPTLDTTLIESVIQEANSQGILAVEDNRVYVPWIKRAEDDVANRLRDIIVAPMPRAMAKISIQNLLSVAQKRSNVKLDTLQLQAIESCLRSKLSVITGGPGVGKTEILKALVSAYQEAHIDTYCMAPTGKAAKRMREVIGGDTSTIHRELYSRMRAVKQGSAIEDVRFENCVIIIDELSMVYLSLMRWLFNFCRDDVVMIFVGDQDQLPSIGPGAVLRDLISSGQIPYTHLTKIYRQAKESDIVMNAHRINSGHLPVLNRLSSNHMPKTDMFTVIIDDADKAADAAVYCGTSFAKHLGFNPVTDCQVLAPMHKGVLGVMNLNQRLQHALNPNPSDVFKFGANNQYVWGVGDKLMQLVNDYELGLLNGDMGTIISFERNKKDSIIKMYFECDGQVFDINRDQMMHMRLSYANTIHKFQGSQMPMIVIVLHNAHYIMLQRNLLYTAITRSQHRCVLCGTEYAIGQAVGNDKISKRNTFLSEKIQSAMLEAKEGDMDFQAFQDDFTKGFF